MKSPGSIVFLNNGQLAYVLENKGPVIIPFTDTQGMPLTTAPDPVNPGDTSRDSGLRIDRSVPIRFPCEVYNKLPPSLRAFAQYPPCR